MASNSQITYPTDTSSKNWFQNRRAKAKQQTQPRSDSSGGEESFTYHGHESHPSDPIDIPEPSNQSLNFPSAEGMLHGGAFISGVPPTRLDDIQLQYPNHLPLLNTNANHLSHTINEVLPRSEGGGDVPLNTFWPISVPSNAASITAPTSSIHELGPIECISESPAMQNYALDGLHTSTYDSHPIYQSAMDGHVIVNTASQPFVTNPTEKGEHSQFFTPPQETSPLPGHDQVMPQDDRRTSNSSDLVENFDTIHLQQPQVGSGFHESPQAAPTVNPTNYTPTGLPTPDISPDIITNNPPFPERHDLASRRKRPRPPTLKSESDRSFSYTGPSTVSPHLRVTPPGSSKMEPVRRVKSTGNGMNVMTGRITKSGTASAQMSPRHVEPFLKTSSKDLRPSARQKLHPADSTSGVVANPLPSHTTPDIAGQGSQLFWQRSDTCQTSVAPPFEYTSDRNTPYGYDQTFYGGWAPPQDSHSNSLENFAYPQLSRPAQPGYHYPPQSAPSHITTFSEISSPFPSQLQQGWSIPLSTVTHQFHDDTQLTAMSRSNHPHHHSHSSPLGYLAHANPAGIEPYPLNEPPFHLTSSLDHKSIEFKIDTGPPPPKELTQALQETKEYTFNNQFSQNFPATNGKK